MKPRLRYWIRSAAALALALTIPTAWGGTPWGEKLAEIVPTPNPPSVAAPSYVLVDVHSGYVLAARDPHEAWEPASLVKMMTAYVVFHELNEGHIALDEEVSISERAWRAPGSRMFVEVGTRVAVEDLLRGLIIQSGNDASIALAEHVAGDEETFAQVMNQHAERLGLENTRFANSTGLPHDDMRTTAADVARLGTALIEEFPEFYAWYSERTFEYGGIRQHNRNRLLGRDDTVDGIKTGHTRSAGYNLAAAAERDGMRLIAVVLGTDSEEARARQSHQLLNYGFRFFETHRLYSGGKSLTEARVWKGEQEAIPLGIREDLYVTIPRRQYDNLSASMSVDGHVEAPVQEGDEIGTLQIQLHGKTIHEVPLIAMEDVAEGSLWRRTFDDILLRFQ